MKETSDISRDVSEILEFIVLSSFGPLFCKTGVSRVMLTRSLEGRGHQKKKGELRFSLR
jgi:hypothetical protein